MTILHIPRAVCALPVLCALFSAVLLAIAATEASAVSAVPEARISPAAPSVPAAQADRFADALAIVPADAISVVAIPSLGVAGADIEQLIDRMGRAETVVGGKPVEQLKGLLGVTAGFDETGSMVAWHTRDRALCVAVPTSDPAAFMEANLKPGADGTATFAGRAVHARALAAHVLVSESRAALDAYAPGAGIIAAITASSGERGIAVARAADMFAWASSDALADALAQAAQQAEGVAAARGGGVPPVPVDSARVQALMQGLSSGLVAIDFDPLGVGVRAIATTKPDSTLAALMAGNGAADDAATPSLSGLPKANFYLAASVDIRAMGGGEKFLELARAVGVEGDFLPEWIASQKDAIRAVRIAAYPSRLGIVAGGVLNDSACIIECDDPVALRDALRTALMGTEGKRDGLRYMPGWESDRKVKDELLADGFELKTEPLGPREAGDVDAGALAMRQLGTQAIFGSRGMHGFMKPVPARKALIITFSQRPDVLTRALAAVEGGSSLGDDVVIKAMDPWLVERPQVVGFLALGQVVRAARQLTEMFGGGGDMIPEIPARTEPIGGAMRFGGGTIEMAAIVPTGTVAFLYDNMRQSALGGLRGGAAAAQPKAADPAPGAKP
jgi:hypothetical protein